MKRIIPVKVNETYSFTIRDLGVHGEGIGSVDGFTVFVPGALPGETVEAALVTVKKSYAAAKLISIREASPCRVQPACPVYGICGGCQISHLSYEGQAAWKEGWVKSVVSRIGGFNAALVRPILAAAHPWNYRNKMAVPCEQKSGGPALGYYRRGTHQVAPISGCAIQEEENNRLLRFTEGFLSRHPDITGYNEKQRKGCLRHVMGRVGDDGKVMAVIVTATDTLPHEHDWVREMREYLPEVVSIYHNVQGGKGNVILGSRMVHLWGEKYLTASLAGLTFDVSPLSFFQVNKEQAEILYGEALKAAALTGKEMVIDAYCGTGTITLALAKQAGQVTGIEIVKPAIEDAKKNAARNHISNADFYAADAGKLMPELYKKGFRPDVIVMDPVRAGCSPAVLNAVAGMAPARIVYVSCNPATFARDAKLLAERGYTLRYVQPVDMFPQTTHVETVSLLDRNTPAGL